MDYTSIGQRHGRSQVARSVTVEERTQPTPAKLQGQIPQSVLDFMHRPTGGQGVREQLDDLRDQILRQFHLENAERICNVHGQASLRVTASAAANLSAGGPFGYQSLYCN